ncbi:unnamed protein product, partial [Prunus brigantina]
PNIITFGTIKPGDVPSQNSIISLELASTPPPNPSFNFTKAQGVSPKTSSYFPTTAASKTAS